MSGKKRKGLSGDEKRDAILRIYHTTMDPYNLKEIENLASKAGVVQQTVKEHNQSLVDDSLVLSDKIGSSVFFWSFPSQSLIERTTVLETTEQQIQFRQEETARLDAHAEELSKDRCAPGRDALIEKLRVLTEESKALEASLDKYKANDPAVMKVYREQCAINKVGAERWTDNTWTIKSYLTRKRGLSAKEVDPLLGTNKESFDDLTFRKTKKKK